MRTLLLLTVMAAGCGPSLPPLRASAPEVVNEVPADCRDAGTEESRVVSATAGGHSRAHNVRAARIRVRNRAADRGATHVVLERPIDQSPDRLEIKSNPMRSAWMGQHHEDPRNEDPPRVRTGDEKTVYAVHKPKRERCGRNCVIVTGRAYRCTP